MRGSANLAGGPGRVAAGTAIAVFLLGAAVLLGWGCGIPSLISVIPGEVKMAPLTALGFVLAGAALGAAIRGREVPARVLAGSLLLIAVLRMGEYATGGSWCPDMLFFREPPLSDPTRMAAATAIDFLLAGGGLLLAGTAWRGLFQGAVVAGALIAWLGFSHFMFGGEPLFHFHYMAIHTCLGFFFLYAGILCLRGDEGLVGFLRDKGMAGEAARRLVPAALIVPMIVGWLRLKVQHDGLIGTEAGISLFALVNIVIFGWLILATVRRLYAMERERKRIAAELDENTARIRAIVDSTEDAIVGTELDGTISSWNRGAQNLFGYALEEVVGKPMLMFFPPDRQEEEERIRERLKHGQSTPAFETVRLRKDGTPLDVSVSISPMRGPGGDVIGAARIARDITERKRADDRLRTQLARLDLLQQITRAIGERQDLRSIFQVVVRTLEDHLPIDFGCVLLHDKTADVLTVASVSAKSAALAQALAMTEKVAIPVDSNGLSRAAAGILVYEPDLLNVLFPFPQRLAQGGLRSLVLAPLSVESEVFGILAVARRGAEAFTSGECEFVRQLSEHTALAAHQAQLLDALQHAYDDLRQTQQAVLQQERLRAFGEMASGVAHDINNTLSPAMIYAQLLLDKEHGLSASARGHLETIQQSIHDVSETIARLREFYRQREPQLTLFPISLNAMALQVADLTRARWNDMPQQRGIVVQMVPELETGLPDILGAESELREALTNLVFNAVDAMPQGGTLTLRTRAEGKGILFEVADTGLGMSDETRRRCLEPFYTTKGESGTGLGLAMVYGIVRRHRADLEIESAPGKGTTIRILFPAAPAAHRAATAPVNAMPDRLRLLLVDDDPLILKSMRDILEADGHVVSIANGGQAGIDAFHEALGKEPFDAVITDLGMPYVDGRAVAKALKTAAPRIPVLLLTGWGKRIVADDEIPAHVDCVLSKPPRLSELRTALAQWTSAK